MTELSGVLVTVLGTLLLAAWLLADAAGGRTAKYAFNTIPALAALAILIGVVL